MVCSSCGAENSAGRKFCGGCGAALALVCPSCAAPNEPGVRFCGECGSPLAAATTTEPTAAAAARDAPVAERRLISVLFADLVGFTALTEARDPEDVRELLSRYFDTAKRLIAVYGGTVEKFIGDAVMAVWGTPAATEDDAERAVRAALDLVAAVTALGDEIGEPQLRARAGVLTGESAVTLGALDEGMVAGDLVNTASRVQAVAPAGSVYVGEATRRATEQAIVYEPAGSFEFKGKDSLTPLWRALRVVSGARGSLKSEGLEAPFVGRDRELRQIKDLFHDAADGRRAHLVSVTGVAGIGKSRLGWEFYKYFDGIAQVVYWHRGRCLAYGDGVTYWALADMVRMRCRIVEDERPEAARAKLCATLEEHVLDAEERRFVEPRLAQLLGLGELEGSERQELFAAWRLFFERFADEYPTVLAFEDMQWADASLLDFVEYLLEWSRSSPLYVLTLARPELTERRPTWGAGHRSFSSIHLEPLPQDAMEELLNGLVPGLPPPLAAQILERAQGVPLYAVETVRMLLDRGLLVREGSIYRPLGEISSLEVPETLHALIAARLDGLSLDERRLLQDGAVFGKTFTKPALAALTGLPEAQIERLLASLVRKEILGVQADPRSPEHGQYGFLQDLIRHVAYETLSRRERRALHLAAADYLASSLAEEEVAEVVASHLVDAYNAGPELADAAAIKLRARDALARAGERAASVAAAAEAHRYFVRAAALTDEAFAKAELADRAGQMSLRAGDSREARVLLEQARQVYESEGRTRAAARVLARIGEIDFFEGKTVDAVARLEPALEALAAGEPDADLAAIYGELGRFLVVSGHGDEEAARHVERALELAAALDLPETLAQALNTRAVLLMFRDRVFEARALLEAALALALDRGLHAAALRAYNNLSEAQMSADRFREAAETVAQALELARRVGDRNWERLFTLESLSKLAMIGRWDEAVALASGERPVDPSELTSQLSGLGLFMIRCERGELEGIRDTVAWQPARPGEDAQIVGAISLLRAWILRADGRPEEALASAERGVAVRAQIGSSNWTAKLALVEALEAAFDLDDEAKIGELLALLDGLPPGVATQFLAAHRSRFHARRAARTGGSAGAGFEAAERGFRHVETPFDLAVTLLEHGEWLTDEDRADEAAPLLAEARAVFAELGAAPWLGRVAALQAQPVG